jgi:hypothetical protein
MPSTAFLHTRDLALPIFNDTNSFERRLNDEPKAQMKFRILLLLASTFALSACGLSDQQKADYASVSRSGVSSAIYDKMVHGDPLSVGDVISLSQARVSDGVIVRYIRDHGTIYVLNGNQIDRLHNAGVSPSVIDFMVQSGSPGFYGYGPYGPGPYGPGPGPYFYPPPIAVGVGFGGHWH